MPVFVSLLRGINVGGHKKIKMAELRALYEALGLTNVNTLLQSGNVVFETEELDPDQVGDQIAQDIQQHFGFECAVIIRARDEWHTIINNHPFSDAELANPRKLLVTFLQSEPDTHAIEKLFEAHIGPETIHADGKELYIHYPHGMGRSKLNNNFIERYLQIIATGRNWNTVNKVLDLLEGM